MNQSKKNAPGKQAFPHNAPQKGFYLQPRREPPPVIPPGKPEEPPEPPPLQLPPPEIF